MSEELLFEALTDSEIDTYLRIEVDGELTPSQMGRILNEVETLYRLLQFFESIEVKQTEKEMIDLIAPLVSNFRDALETNIGLGRDDVKYSILENIQKEYDFSLSIVEIEKILIKIEKHFSSPYDLQGVIDKHLEPILLRFLSNRGLQLRSDIFESMSSQQLNGFRRALTFKGYLLLNKKKLYEVTNNLPFGIKLIKVRYNSPGSLDFLGIGKVLEVIKDFILESRKLSRSRKREDIELEILEEELKEKKNNNYEKSLNNVEKWLQLKEKYVELDKKNMSELDDILSASKKSLAFSSKNINDIRIIDESEIDDYR